MVTHDVEEATLLSDRVYVLTLRPGMVKTALSVDIPRPRRYDMVTDGAFVETKARVMAALRGDDAWNGAGANDASPAREGRA